MNLLLHRRSVHTTIRWLATLFLVVGMLMFSTRFRVGLQNEHVFHIVSGQSYNFSFPNLATFDIEFFRTGEYEQKKRPDTKTLHRLNLTHRQHLSAERIAKYFAPLITEDERLLLLKVFQEFTRICLDHDIVFMLYGGTLMGSYRHHNLIPWDDDIDVWVNASQKTVLLKAFESANSKDFEFYIAHNSSKPWKMYWNHSEPLGHRPWKWPYVDIFFFVENSSHILDENPELSHQFVFKKQDVFPLGLRPFNGAFLPVPCNIRVVLQTTYTPSLCKPTRYSHKWEDVIISGDDFVSPCNKLQRLFPFVKVRRKTRAIIQETIFVGDEQLSEATFPAPKCTGIP